ncbi:hypothetical protein [Nonomuraea cavernae]|uniref:hypothetical protein n=1 Tax=Nonomuraea cavernae TaxID=2045107 RepID=UPI00166B6D56|nr:hypothetical protein [Nonomuraea cavernae]MCA2189371.1 hypothetical protein [Nonomuraea cavernae]
MPRHRFITPVGQAHDEGVRLIDREADPDDGWDAVYSDTGIVTQLDDGDTDVRRAAGDYTSSASQPSMVADLLRWLDPEPGHRVLEVGTGWTCVLLSHLVGEGGVTSVEVDPAVAGQAAGNLREAGVHPHLIVGDGAAGCPERAPFDRVHVTCGVRV